MCTCLHPCVSHARADAFATDLTSTSSFYDRKVQLLIVAVYQHRAFINESYFNVVKGPNGGDVSTRITETTAGSFRVEYTPMTAGKWND